MHNAENVRERERASDRNGRDALSENGFTRATHRPHKPEGGRLVAWREREAGGIEVRSRRGEKQIFEHDLPRLSAASPRLSRRSYDSPKLVSRSRIYNFRLRKFPHLVPPSRALSNFG